MTALKASFKPRSVSDSDREALMRLTAGRPAVIWGPYIDGRYQWTPYSTGSWVDDDGYSIEVSKYGGGGQQWPVVAVLWHDQSWYPSSNQGAIELFRVSDYGIGYEMSGIDAYDDIQSGAAAYGGGSRFASESERQTFVEGVERQAKTERQAAVEQAAIDQAAAEAEEDQSLIVRNIIGLAIGIIAGWAPWRR